jgi:hypothetical protein
MSERRYFRLPSLDGARERVSWSIPPTPLDPPSPRMHGAVVPMVLCAGGGGRRIVCGGHPRDPRRLSLDGRPVLSLP